MGNNPEKQGGEVGRGGVFGGYVLYTRLAHLVYKNDM